MFTVKSLQRCLIPAVMILLFIFPLPVLAQMKKVDDAELARTNASVTGNSVKDQATGVEKSLVRTETEQTPGILDKGGAVSSLSLSKSNVMESIGLNLNINGQETFKFYYGGSTSTVTGGVKAVTPH